MSRPLVLGELQDYLTGETIADTADERLRQRVARHLVEQSGYALADIAARAAHEIESAHAASGVETVVIDFVVSVRKRAGLVIRYGPGSLVSRERPTIAAARRLEPACVVPIAVATNGRDARILDAVTKKLIATGLDRIPTRAELARRLEDQEPTVLSAEHRAAEGRILLAYDHIDRTCGCDG